MRAFVFPGQGSQKKGMGERLFDEVYEFMSREREIDALLGYSVREVCLQDPAGILRDTRYTQPCLFVVNALHYYRAVADGVRANVVAGHSLGEFNALLAAGVFDLLTGLQLVKRRGEIMSEAKGGAMAAVIGLPADEVSRVLRDEGLFGVDVANYNAPTQTVIAGPASELDRAESAFEDAGAHMFVPLPVSGAFHSRHVRQAAHAFGELIADVPLAAPRLRVISNVTGEPYPMNDGGDAIKDLLVKQMTCPVQWEKSVRYLLGLGVTQCVEVGPGNVLTKLIDQTRREVEREAVARSFDENMLVPLY